MTKKIVSMSGNEIMAKYGKNMDSILAAAKTSPVVDFELNPGDKVVARGFAQFKDYINHNECPPLNDGQAAVYDSFRARA